MLTLILKSLNDCNLRCAYCSVGSKANARFLSKDRMSDALLFFAAYAEKRGEREVTVIFHGGEPMLLPAAQYENCIQDVTERFPELDFRFSMQTNGTLLSPEYIELFQKHEIHVGVSLDGSREVHDGQRRSASGLKTYELILEHIRMMQDHGIPVAALMVATKPALSASLDFLQDFDRLDLPLKINPLMSLGDAVRHPELWLEPGDYGRYLARVFEYVGEHTLRIPIAPLDEMLHSILYGGDCRGCQHTAHCHSRFLCVDPEGIIYPCGRFADAHENAIGTLEEGLTETGRDILKRLEVRRTSGLPERCRTCRYLQFCHAGCSADQSWELAAAHPCVICDDFRYIFHYLKTQGMARLRQQLLKERADLVTHMSEIGALTDGI